jgi:tetratricopeptide (TPR) repeat protein
MEGEAMSTVRTVSIVVLVLLLATNAFAKEPEWEMLDREAIRLRVAKQYDRAEAAARKAVAAAEKANGPQDPSVATCLSTLAEIYSDKGLYEQAVPYIERILTILKRQSGPDSPDIATAMSSVADSFMDEGRYAQAEPLYKRALAIREKELGPEHPDVAASLCALASMYHDQKRYVEAENLLRRALAIREKALGPDDPAVAASLNNLATLYHSQGLYTQAEPLYKRALAIQEKVLGVNHAGVAVSLTNLGMLYRAQKQYDQAEPLLRRALAIREKTLDPDDPDVAMSLANLAALYNDQRQYAKAERLCERAVAIQEKKLGPNHPDVAQSLELLAGIYRKRGRILEADKLEARAAMIHQAAKNAAEGVTESQKPLITNYEAPGNLEERFSLGCVGREQISNRYNPVELYIAAKKCIEQERYKDGNLLFTLAGVYTRFDIYRVDDKTVGGANAVLVMGIFGSVEQQKKEAFLPIMEDESKTPEKLAALCREIVQIGPPDYYPRYMVQHGMNAYLGKVPGDGLVKDFDAKAAWKKALDTYLHCPNL